VGHSDAIDLSSSGRERTNPKLNRVELTVRWSKDERKQTVCLVVLAHEVKGVKVEIAMIERFGPARGQMSGGEIRVQGKAHSTRQ